jgi:hypothetical protein
MSAPSHRGAHFRDRREEGATERRKTSFGDSPARQAERQFVPAGDQSARRDLHDLLTTAERRFGPFAVDC